MYRDKHGLSIWLPEDRTVIGIGEEGGRRKRASRSTWFICISASTSFVFLYFAPSVPRHAENGTELREHAEGSGGALVNRAILTEVSEFTVTRHGWCYRAIGDMPAARSCTERGLLHEHGVYLTPSVFCCKPYHLINIAPFLDPSALKSPARL